MRNRFDRQLLELNNELIQMGSLIEQAIEMGISALVKQDIEKARICFKGLVPEKDWVMNYPYGNYSDAVIRYIQENRCALALGVEAGSFVMERDNVYTIPRYDANDVYPKGTLV